LQGLSVVVGPYISSAVPVHVPEAVVVVPYISATVPVHVPEAFELPGPGSSRNPQAARKWEIPCYPVHAPATLPLATLAVLLFGLQSFCVSDLSKSLH